MDISPHPLRHRDHSVATLLQHMYAADSLADVTKTLRAIADHLNCVGSILWRVRGNSHSLPPDNGLYLYPLAQSFAYQQTCHFHTLPLENSLTGTAISTRQPLQTSDASNDHRVYLHDFICSLQIKTILSAPLQYHDQVLGALNLYRLAAQPFNDDEIDLVMQLSNVLPLSYEALWNNIGLRLVTRLSQVIESANPGTAQKSPTLNRHGQPLESVTDLISKSYQCLETSVFLTDTITNPSEFHLRATTWPWPESFPKPTYRSEESTLTSWVIRHRTPVTIYDLFEFRAESQHILRSHPDISWSDSLQISPALRRYLKLADDADLLPLSFMAAPIVVGDRVIGAIRCSAPLHSPYYFGDRDLALLGIIASQIGQYWTTTVGQHDLIDESRSWRALVDSVGQLTALAKRELSRPTPNEQYILREALRVASSSIQGADILDIRLFDESRGELYLAATYGDAWHSGSTSDRDQRIKKRYPVNGELHRSIGASVFLTREVYMANDSTHDVADDMFPETRRILVVPIVMEDKCFGVIDIRGVGDNAFPRHARSIAGLLGEQLGLYHYLSMLIGRMQTAESELRRSMEVQARTMEDLKHQLSTPIIQLHKRIQSVLLSRAVMSDEYLLRRLQAVRGLSSKSKRVSMNTGLFAALAAESVIPFESVRLSFERLSRLLAEAAADTEIMLERYRSISVRVEKRSIEIVRDFEVDVDPNLLEQAVSCILDNAGKYSFNDTTIRVYCGVTGTGRFHITVANTGIKLLPSDVRFCSTRGWRSQQAIDSTGEGTGIGLWVVDAIMKAHGGELVVVPTSSDGVTEAKLVFPAARL